MCLHSKVVLLFYYNGTILSFIKNSLSEKKYTTNIGVERLQTTIHTTTCSFLQALSMEAEEQRSPRYAVSHISIMTWPSAQCLDLRDTL